MALFNPSRDEVRRFFFDTWTKFKQQQVLTDLEKIALQVMQIHTEYHHVLDDPEHYSQQDYFPEMGETNPFLHMSLHLSILEQIGINQPTGISQAYIELQKKHGNDHDAQHDIMDCLAEVIWQAQRDAAQPNSEVYLACMLKKTQSI